MNTKTEVTLEEYQRQTDFEYGKLYLLQRIREKDGLSEDLWNYFLKKGGDNHRAHVLIELLPMIPKELHRPQREIIRRLAENELLGENELVKYAILFKDSPLLAQYLFVAFSGQPREQEKKRNREAVALAAAQ